MSIEFIREKRGIVLHYYRGVLMSRLKFKINSKFFKFLLKIFGYILLFYVLTSAEVVECYLHPFGVAVLFALLCVGVSFVPLIIGFSVGGTLSLLSLHGIYITACMAGVCVVVYILHRFARLPINKRLIWLYLLASFPAYVYFNYSTKLDLLFIGISIALSIVLMYATICSVRSFFVRGYNVKLNLDEYVCACVCLLAFCMGLFCIRTLYIDACTLFVALSILVLSNRFSATNCMVCACVFGLAPLVYTHSLIYVGVYMMYALACLAFVSKWRVLSSIAIVLMHLAVSVVINEYIPFSIYPLISVAVGAVLFMCMPQSLLKYISKIFAGRNKPIAMSIVADRAKDMIVGKLQRIVDVFDQMNVVFRYSVRGGLDKQDAMNMIEDELCTAVCSTCPMKDSCLRTNGTYTTEIFHGIVETGLERGHITLIDVPQYLSCKCGRLNYLLTTANNLISTYKQCELTNKNMDNSRVLVAEQMGGVSTLLRGLCAEIGTTVQYESDIQESIVENLLYNGIVCYEAVVCNDSVSRVTVTLLLDHNNIDYDLVQKVVSSSTKKKLKVSEVSPSKIANVDSVILTTRPNYDIVYGVATASKNANANGDSFSVISLADGKYMLALCDGMGTGQNASKMSSLAITIIENFYRAGFDNNTILSSVNKLLCVNNEDEFSTVDVCVVDCVNNYYDFIKLGATYGFIKHEKSVEIIQNSGLPIGVLEEVKPHVTKKLIDPFDIVILVSDGVSEAYEDVNTLQEIILNIQDINPQTICNKILSIAKEKRPSSDDMTVLAMRVFPV